MTRPSKCLRADPSSDEVCNGEVQTLYLKKGSPPRRIAIGRMCIRCRTVDPWNNAGLELADSLATSRIAPMKNNREAARSPSKPRFRVGSRLRQSSQTSRVATRPRAIIFDGDDTLWLTEPLYDQARQHA